MSWITFGGEDQRGALYTGETYPAILEASGFRKMPQTSYRTGAALRLGEYGIDLAAKALCGIGTNSFKKLQELAILQQWEC
jgi:hypothetical protein